jgi:hypothetical protein
MHNHSLSRHQTFYASGIATLFAPIKPLPEIAIRPTPCGVDKGDGKIFEKSLRSHSAASLGKGLHQNFSPDPAQKIFIMIAFEKSIRIDQLWI